MNVKDALNRANPTELSDLLRRCKVGDILSGLTAPVEEELDVANDAATLSQSAGIVQAVYASTVGQGGSSGVKALVPPTVTPAAGQACLAVDGVTLALAAADVVTKVKVLYCPKPTEAANLTADWPSRN